MTNDKNNINELVDQDDDPTAELEALVLHTVEHLAESEASAHTAGLNGTRKHEIVDVESVADLQAEIESRTAAVDRLNFDLVQMQTRLQGLEAELEARSRITTQLQTDAASQQATLKRKQSLLKKRDRQIKALRIEIRERNELQLHLQQQISTISRQLASNESGTTLDEENRSALHAGQLASNEIAMHELQQRHQRLEAYADHLRQQLQDHTVDAEKVRHTCEFLQYSLDHANERVAALQLELAERTQHAEKLSSDLEVQSKAHDEEIRMIRFELGAAQETVAQHELLTEQLASDLVETRTYRVELENMLSETTESNKARINRLENENRALRRETADLEQKLETKNEAINCLILELAKKSQKADAARAVDDAVQEIEDHIASRDEKSGVVERDKVTRLLIGSIDDQELRFPLFKGRLTIGRTEQNDIQLKASHISRRHAVVVTEGAATRVIDWGSKNGVFVNAVRIKEHFLKHGDVVTVGTAQFRYEERVKRDT